MISYVILIAVGLTPQNFAGEIISSFSSPLKKSPGGNGRRQLLELKVPKLLYISSGRAFLRDVAYLTTKRGYRLQDTGR